MAHDRVKPPTMPATPGRRRRVRHTGPISDLLRLRSALLRRGNLMSAPARQSEATAPAIARKSMRDRSAPGGRPAVPSKRLQARPRRRRIEATGCALRSGQLRSVAQDEMPEPRGVHCRGLDRPRRHRPYLGAVLLAYYDPEGRLTYARRAGTGMSEQDLERVWRRLQPLTTGTMPLDVAPPHEPIWLAAGAITGALGAAGAGCRGQLPHLDSR